MGSTFNLFDGKDLSSLFKDIYNNQQSKKKNISSLIETIRVMVKTSSDAAVLAPIIKDLIEVSVKNDEQLVKLATIAQRLASAESKGIGDDGYLTASEKKQLLQALEAEIDDIDYKTDSKIENLQDEIDDIKHKIELT